MCNDYGKYSAEARQACRKACRVCGAGKKKRCKKNECWCVNAGADSCNGRTCDPDECHDKMDCPGNGYWCEEDTGSGEGSGVMPHDLLDPLPPRCTCTSYVAENGYGNCERNYKNKGAICYVNEPSTCTDLMVSKRQNGKRYSWEACSNRFYVTGPPPGPIQPQRPPQPPGPPSPPLNPRPRQEGEECDLISSQMCKFNCEPCETGLECIRSQPPSNGGHPPSNGIQPRSEKGIGICRQPILSGPRQEGEECGPSSNPACNSDCGPCAPGLECVKLKQKNNLIQPRSDEIPSF